MKKAKNWEEVLQEFMKKWKNKKEVIGALVCGSYITGNPTIHSDIDVHIILDSKTIWRERGNVIVDGYLIEYFANPAKMHYKYMEEDYKERCRNNAHMFCTGKVLFDKTGELARLIESSKKYLYKKYPGQKMILLEIEKYGI